MKYIFIINPTSGFADSSNIIKRINEYCLDRNIEYVIEITKCKGDAIKLCKKYKKDKNVIFAVGGDGTLNECVNGIIGSKNRLGLIPSGSGNDFYKTISKYTATEMIIDLGKVNDLYFINVASIGIDAEVGANAIMLKEKGVKPNQIYNRSIIYTFLNFRNKKIEVETENSINLNKFTLLSVCNASYYGGGYYIAPEADLTDGMFDVYIAEKIPRALVPGLIMKLKKGTHAQSPYISKKVLNKIKLKSKNELICCVDGEIIKDKSFKFKVIKKGIVFYQDKELINYVLN